MACFRAPVTSVCTRGTRDLATSLATCPPALQLQLHPLSPFSGPETRSRAVRPDAQVTPAASVRGDARFLLEWDAVSLHRSVQFFFSSPFFLAVATVHGTRLFEFNPPLQLSSERTSAFFSTSNS